MGIFLTHGYPHPSATLPLLETIADSGADFLELGMPFSDPLAEGLPIQESSERALSFGLSLADIFRTVETYRRKRDTPILLMGYINPVFSYGIGNFCKDARSSGVDGIILPDVPPEEISVLRREVESHDLNHVLLVAPNTSDDRMREIDSIASGFVYAVSVTGLTGSSLDAMDLIADYLRRARKNVRNNPLLVGFGIRSGEDARRLSKHTDGFIVGSAVIRQAGRLWDSTDLSTTERLNGVASFVRSLKSEPANGQP